MCGHGSITLSSAAERPDLDAGANAMLMALVSRGRDASGIMSVNLKGEVRLQKAAVPASDFVKGRYLLRKDARAVAVHTRAATKGAKGWDRNNHPVLASGVALMHNGVVYDEWLERAATEPEVDTYALAKLASTALKGLAEHAKPEAKAAEIVRALFAADGSATVQVAFPGSPSLISAKIRSNPLFICDVEGIRLTSSTSEAIEKALEAMAIAVPVGEVEFTKTEKGKEVKYKEEAKLIFVMSEGQHALWFDGKHSFAEVEPAAPTHKRAPVPQQTYQGYGAGSAWQNRGNHTSGAASHGNRILSGLAVGDQVELIAAHTNRVGEIKHINFSASCMAPFEVEWQAITRSDGSESPGWTSDYASSTIKRVFPKPGATRRATLNKEETAVSIHDGSVTTNLRVGDPVTAHDPASPYAGRKGIVQALHAPTSGFTYPTISVRFEKLKLPGNKRKNGFSGVFQATVFRPWLSADQARHDAHAKGSTAAPPSPLSQPSGAPTTTLGQLGTPKKSEAKATDVMCDVCNWFVDAQFMKRVQDLNACSDCREWISNLSEAERDAQYRSSQEGTRHA